MIHLEYLAIYCFQYFNNYAMNSLYMKIKAKIVTKNKLRKENTKKIQNK